jgi:hypothetical protein
VTTTYTTVAERFEDTVNFMIVDGSTEVWHFPNLMKNMHPMDLHLVQFRAIQRDLYDVSGFDDETLERRCRAIQEARFPAGLYSVRSSP